MATRLIVSADDFGASEDVNAAVVKGCREGVLTSAGLMVTGTAFREAVRLAKDEPGLAVGLHLTLSNGASVLPHRAIGRLVDSRSRFRESPARAALRYYLDKSARRQLSLEITAQFEALAATGLKISHVDGHQHLHAHPMVLPTVIELARKYGAAGMRVPKDPVWANLRADRSGLATKAVVALGHGYLARVCHRLLADSGLATCDLTIGSLMSGRMSSEYVMRMLDQLNCGSVEVFFHPSTAESRIVCGPNAGDLRAILDPALRSYVAGNAFELTTFVGLRREGDACELG